MKRLLSLLITRSPLERIVEPKVSDSLFDAGLQIDSIKVKACTDIGQASLIDRKAIGEAIGLKSTDARPDLSGVLIRVECRVTRYRKGNRLMMCQNRQYLGLRRRRVVVRSKGQA